MKKKRTILKCCGLILALSLIIIPACVNILDIIQPSKAGTNSSFEVKVILGPDIADSSTDYYAGDQINCGYIGILMPAGWMVDEDEFYFYKYTDEGEEAYERDGYVFRDVEHEAALEAKDPAAGYGRDYKWWGGVSDIFDMHAFARLEFTVKILTDDIEGEFFMKYVFGDKDAQDLWRYPWYDEAVSDLLPIELIEGYGSIKENNQREQVKIYPGVTTGYVTIEAPAKSTVKVFDLSGKMLFKKELGLLDNNINLTGYPKGVYVVSVSTGSVTKNQKVVLQ